MLCLFNTNIVPSPAVVRVTTISREVAREIITITDPTKIISAIGHEATANCLSKILEIIVKPNRIDAQPIHNDLAISLKLNCRIEEGRILSTEEMNKIGYTLYLMEFYDVDYSIHSQIKPTQ